jgi:penicillin-binding protein 1A
VVPALPDQREQIVDPLSAYQLVSMLEGVVQRGTGTIVRSVGKPIAGKTGTTNDSFDAWFVGFTPDLVAGVWVGFDQPRTLGEAEQGASVAAPIFRDFMAGALEGKPGTPFRIPQGIRLVRINEATGAPAQPGDQSVIVEAFKPGTEPTLAGGGGSGTGLGGFRKLGHVSGTGGLY